MPEMPTEFIHDEAAFRKQIPFPIESTNLPGVYHIPPPPDDFDPRTASQTECLRYGILLPRRQPEDTPRGIAVNQAMDKFFGSRKWLAKDRIVPVLDPQDGKSHGFRGSGKPIVDGAYSNYSWAGSINFGDSWNCVTATWKIPTVSQPNTQPGALDDDLDGWASESWIGIDGILLMDGVPVSGLEVLQAGISQVVPGEGVPGYTAWFAWFTSQSLNTPPYTYQTNLSMNVTAGDEMYCSVQYLGKIAAILNFANNTTGQTISMCLAPPASAQFLGQSCEWIMECPNDGEFEGDNSLPNFTPLTFDAAFGCGPGAEPTVPGTVFMNVDIQNQNNVLITQTTRGFFSTTIEYIGM